VHELAHEMLEHAKRRTTTTKVVRETEAESIAFVVGKAVEPPPPITSTSIRQCFLGRELGSHTTDLSRHPGRIAAVRNRDDARCRTSAGAIMQTLLHIVEKAGGFRPSLYLSIENPPFLALVVEALDESGPLGLPSISVAHYGTQNGDIRDPEMCFELSQPIDGLLSLDPFYWRNDYVAVEQSGCRAFLKRSRTSPFVTSPLPWSGYRQAVSALFVFPPQPLERSQNHGNNHPQRHRIPQKSRSRFSMSPRPTPAVSSKMPLSRN
jgi:hypothetical protein